MSDGVRADIPAMEKFAATSDDRADAFINQRTMMNVVRLAPGDFGYIPGIGHRVHEAYGDYVDGINGALGSMADVMNALADAVKDAAVAYRETDGEIATMMNGLAGAEVNGGR
mgnify:CR=1 FL=1